MKKEKLSLKGIKNVLSRSEMKKIMAGSGYGAPSCCVCYSPSCGSLQIPNTNAGCVAVCMGAPNYGECLWFNIGAC